MTICSYCCKNLTEMSFYLLLTIMPWREYITENRYKPVYRLQASVCAHCRQASMETCVFLYPYCLVFCSHVCFALQGCSRIRKEKSSTGFNDHHDHQLGQLKLWRAEDRPIVTELLSIRPLRPCQVYLCTMEIKRGWRENSRKMRGVQLCASVFPSNPSILSLSLFFSCFFCVCGVTKNPSCWQDGQLPWEISVNNGDRGWKERNDKHLTKNWRAWNK